MKKIFIAFMLLWLFTLASCWTSNTSTITPKVENKNAEILQQDIDEAKKELLKEDVTETWTIIEEKINTEELEQDIDELFSEFNL